MRIKRFLVIVVLTISLMLIYLGSALAQEDPPPPQNPVAVFLSEATGISYDEIINLQKSGHGLGNIARAYNFVSAAGITTTISEVYESRSQGIGWGQLYKEAELKPGGGGQGLGWLLGKNKGANRSKHTRPPEWAGGPPDHASPPDHAGPKPDSDEPEPAGPPVHGGPK